MNNHNSTLNNQSNSSSPNSNGPVCNLDSSPNQLGQANGSLAAGPEKPLHYTYLKGFRVEQCALFLQHKCINHKPFTCFDWHFQNQRRRRPVRRRDGTFNYSPDTYCTKYDETTGLCPDKDDCPYLHKTAGDTERRYHLRYYKTGICVYETDSRGYCSKNGKHCAFAHGTQDLRNPVFDVREMQTLENGNSSGSLSDTIGSLAPGSNGAGNVVSAAGVAAAASAVTIDRERNALLEDPRWNETAYVLANYKTVLCKRPPRFCRQGYACPQYHNGKDRRRSPKLFKYRSTPCPNTKQGDEWVDPIKCEQGDQCPYCHSRTEQQFHPEIFKSTKCKDIQDTGYCPRGAFCAFAHNEEEIIATRDIDLDIVDTECSQQQQQQPAMSQSYPGERRLIENHQLSEELRSILENQFNDTTTTSSDSLIDSSNHHDIIGNSSIASNNNILTNNFDLNDRIRPFDLQIEDHDDIFSSNDKDNSDADTIVNNLLGIESVIRPRSTSISANSSLFSTSSGIDLRSGSILQQQQHHHQQHQATITNSCRSPTNINNNNNNNNSNNSSLTNNIFKTNNNARLNVSFADQNNSALPSSSLTSSTASPNQTTKNNLGPIARPRSYSHSQARSINPDFNQLHAALARARLIDESRMQAYGLTSNSTTSNSNNNNNTSSIGFRERAVQSFSISSLSQATTSLFNSNHHHPTVSALDFLPSSHMSNLNLGSSKELDLGQLVNSGGGSNSQNNSLAANQSSSLSPNSNRLVCNLDSSPNQLGQANGSLAAGPEKPLHYTYLKGFRVEQCALFLQHKCINHKPFTCFDWHFQNQRRRRPVRRRDGTFNYSPDTYCTKYDETTGLCPDKDDCPYLHKTAGDTERRYHLRYYKTGICVYETDSRGYCSKNGKHCAFAHGTQDLRNPVFDVREMQTLENGNSSGSLSDTIGSLAPGSNGAGNVVSAAGVAAAASAVTIDRERNALLEDPRWNETAYVLANYKTVLCKRPPRFCRQGYACPQYHNGKDRRRSPKLFKYRSTPCPNTKQGDEWVDPIKCEQGDQCPYCHSRTEQQFHPEIFKSTKCKDIQDTGYCPRGAFCAFAHNEEEIIATRDIDLDIVDTECSQQQQQQPAMSQSYPGERRLIENHQLSEELRSMLENQFNIGLQFEI